MDQFPIRMLRAARQAAYYCGLEPLLKRSHRLTSIYRAAYNRAKPEGFAEIPLSGYTLMINAADSSIAYNLLTLGSYEPFESSLFLESVQRGENIIDIGAHVGYYALMAASALRGKGSVWAFEPHPANFSLLQRNIERNELDNLFAANVAVSDHAGLAPLYVAQDGNTGGHSLAPRAGQSQRINVPLVRIDDVIPAGTRVSVIKMDTEGHEVEVIRGMKRVLTVSNPVLFTEFFPAALMRAGHEPDEYLGELKSLGFDLALIDSDHKQIIPISVGKLLQSCPQNGALNLFCRKATPQC